MQSAYYHDVDLWVKVYSMVCDTLELPTLTPL